MPWHEAPRPRVRPAILAAAAFVLLGLFRGSQRLTFETARSMIPDLEMKPPPPRPAFEYLWGGLLAAAVWFALTPLLFRFFRRFPIRRPHVARDLAAHAGGFVLFAAAHQFLTMFLGLATWSLSLPPPSAFAGFPRLLLVQGWGRLPVYAAIVAIFWGLENARRSREEERRLLALEAELSAARLDTLKTQLNPPFFFSTLNTILPLVEKDPDAAAGLVVHLGDLLRTTFEKDGGDFVSVESELRTLDLYLKIETARFADRLSAACGAAVPARGARVPRLILVPLAEFAIGQGIGRRTGPGRLSVSARASCGRLTLDIREDGPERLTPPFFDHRALTGTRERLRHLFGDDARLDARREPGGGLLVTLDLPLSYQEAERIAG
jgi:two-component system, LytTR family, sensor kinase